MENLHKSEQELGIDYNKPLEEHNLIDKLNDLERKKRKHADDIHDYFRSTKRYKSPIQYEDHPAGTVLNEPCLGLKRLHGFLEVTAAQVHNGNYAKCVAGGKIMTVKNRSRFGINKWYQILALRNFDLEDMELESTNSGPTAKFPILKLGEYEMWAIRITNGLGRKKRTKKKNDVKARGLLLIALPNEHQLTFSQYLDAKSMFAAIETRFGARTKAANTAYSQVSATSPSVNTASPQVCTASVNDNTVYAFMVENLNGSNVLHQDLEQIHEDDLEAMDLKWECYNCHKLGHFARECRASRSKEDQFRNQDNTRKQGNKEDTSKAMLAIHGVGFDWSDMVEEQVQINMALMTFPDSECDGNKPDLQVRNVASGSQKESNLLILYVGPNPQQMIKDSVDSGCSRHMTGKFDGTSDEKVISLLDTLISSKAFRGENNTRNQELLEQTTQYTVSRISLQDEDGLNNENAEQKRFSDDSNSKDVNAVGQQVNTASPELNVVGPSVSTASLNEEDNTEEEPEVDLGNITNSYIIPNTPNTRIHIDHLIDNVIGEVQSTIEPTSIAKALSDSSWVEAMQEELLQFKLQQVWILVDLPNGKKAIGTKWVFRNKKDERGIVIRNKARLVAHGHRQEKGIDYEEVFTPVARIVAIRLFFAYASFMGFLVYQMDVKSAFLYGSIEEEVYVTQPPGFKDPDHPDKVYKVVKALYGLHQAPRVW
ncbi:putative ribonuclease H-like domain-containing protein [Tanacetum coccineum]